MRFKIPYWPLLLGPAISYGIGFLLNSIVMAANSSQMPVLAPGGHINMIDPSDLWHCAMTAKTHLKFLADWIVLGDGIASPGDFFLWLSGYTFIPGLSAWLALIIRDKHTDFGS